MMRRHRHKAGARRRLIARLDERFMRWLGLNWTEANRRYEAGGFADSSLARTEIESYRWILGIALLLLACCSSALPPQPRVPQPGVAPVNMPARWVAPAVLCLDSRLVWADGWRCA